MRNQSILAESTIIIEPGSYHLRIGRAVDQSPKLFPHCIARRPKLNQSAQISPIINRIKLDAKSVTFQKGLINTRSNIDKIFQTTSESILSQSNYLFHPLHSSEKLPKLLDWDTLCGQDEEFYVLNEALEKGSKAGYHLNWPMRGGLFSTTANYSSTLQDLEDIWCFALEKHVGVAKASFTLHRVILVINDVYRRNEIRYLMQLLFERLHFDYVFVHLASVCATYALGLPTACIVNIGHQKTIVCCVDEGISHGDTRVLLPVGSSDVNRTLHALFLPEGFVNEDGRISDLSYDVWSDVEDLRQLTDCASEAAVDALHQMNETENVKNDALHNIEVSFKWRSIEKKCDNLVLNIPQILISNLMPFGNIGSVIFNYNLHMCLLQLPSTQSSEPDDPFDELYIALTAKEKRKRTTGQTVVSTESTNNNNNNGIQAEVENELSEQNAGLKATQFHTFQSLPETIYWSINQCANLIRTPATDLSQPTATSLPILKEEMVRRLLSNVILTGGSACGATGTLIETWLTSQLTEMADQLTRTKKPSTPVEINVRPNSGDISWIGARLLLTTELINDLWLTQSEWQRYGSRIIREKAPFMW